ncbi:serine/threonine-protein kinase [Nannocystis sp. ILAH1]|uniref:serine/threonine-protein kinase n=1 Tax=unclassified Nannocystis TaxID=2627009 RepID=UPI0022709C08|nr:MULTISPECIES: serine/threonine-protein kinase [unclassified Nannocystis]MCY0992956.1 serine/threonine-protein kinase [Nannocystis sp. ILAH1]MCY1066210.1 serine/threonine-protein kinase [Nannocystis sp. RBIL2]
MTAAALERLSPSSDTLQASDDVLLHPLEQIRRQVAASLFDEPHEPSAIGRFQVLRVVGAGGMGVVYAARDPQLDRTVALKLLRPGQLGPLAQQRLLREAQAMARLQHPNVLAVFDAGIHAGQVWLAMEYEGGGTLGDWLRAAPRRWQEVVEVLTQAGRGLAAAHAAGLVHRDFKPANVLVGGGRIRISDFGLARLGEDAVAEAERTADEHAAALAEPMTRTGAVLGTPAYMAPEQLMGLQATARSDQFAFCVVLFEALHGHRPFRGETLAQLCEAFAGKELVRPTRALPRALQAVLTRGLQIDPAARYPSMDALLAALARASASRAWRPALMVAGVAVSSAMAFGAYVYSSKEPPTSSAAVVTEELGFKYNDRPGKDIDEVWNTERARALRWALPRARDEVDMLVLALDAYAARWLEVSAKPSATKDQFNWTNTCLADRLTALDDLVIAAGEGVRESAMLVGNAHEFLPDLADCEQSSQYNTLTSQGFAPTRRMSWRARLLMAGGFGPRALHAARLPELGKGFEALGSAHLLGDARVNAEIELATALLGFHDPTDEPNTYSYTDPRTGERIVHSERQLPPRARTLKLLQGIAERSAAAGFADVAARAWAATAELLEAGPHSERARMAAWDGLRAALAKLPAEHRLRRRLAADLAIFAAAHVRHAVPAGSCVAPDGTLPACEVVRGALDDFATALRGELDPSRRGWLRRQQAALLEYVGDVAGAAALRQKDAGELDERSPQERGYLDFSVGTIVPHTPDTAESLRCTYDHSRCEIDPAVLKGEIDPEALLEGSWFMPDQEDGQLVGFRVMVAHGSEVMRRLDLAVRDRIVAVDGAPVGPDFMWDTEAVLGRGRLTLTLDRGGTTIEREYVLRAPRAGD